MPEPSLPSPPQPVFPGQLSLEGGCLAPGWASQLLTLCPSPTDKGTIHKVVESGDQEHSLVFNILEIQPFRRAATIQAMSLDADRVSLPTPQPPLSYGAAQ